jgi:putative protease
MILTTETPDETQNVLKAFTEHCRTEGETTSGHWKRAVE